MSLNCDNLPNIATSSAKSNALYWRIEYDEQGRIARGIDPAERATCYTYTSSFNGSLRAVTETPPDSSPVTRTFDAEGKIEGMIDREGEVVYHYNNRKQLESINRTNTPTIRYSYDDADRVIALNVGDFYRIAWTYDFLGRISKIDTPAGAITYEYQTGMNTVVRSLPNGVKTFSKRQPNGELDEITHGYFKKPDDRSYSVLARYTYGHGLDGRITGISELSRGEVTRRYSYDTMEHLTRATAHGGREYRYEYDQLGNRTKASSIGAPDQLCCYDWAGRLITVDGKSVQYDNCGNLSEVTLDGVTRDYRYHPDGHLAEVKIGNEAVQYRYDGNGRLIVRKEVKGETHFIPDPLSSYWQPLVIEEENGTRTLVIWDGNSPLALVREDKVEWLLQDHLGSVRLVTDSKGNVTHTCDYDPFGVPITESQQGRLYPGFAGLFRDDQAGGYLTLARLFLPKLGSFLQPDPQKNIPSESELDYSLYSYCQSEPVNLVDLDGASPEPPLGFWKALENGRFFGTRFGDEATAYWAQQLVQTGNPLYVVPGLITALWTTETWTATFLAATTIAETLLTGGANLLLLTNPQSLLSIFSNPQTLRNFFYNPANFKNGISKIWHTAETTGKFDIDHLFLSQDLPKNLIPNINKFIERFNLPLPSLPPLSQTWSKHLTGLLNGGWNHLIMPTIPVYKSLSLNTWMGFVKNWNNPLMTAKAIRAHRAVRAYVIATVAAAWRVSTQIGTALNENLKQIDTPLHGFQQGLENFWNIIDSKAEAAEIPEIYRQSNGNTTSSQTQNSPTDSSVTSGGAFVHTISARATPQQIADYKAAGQYKALEPSSVGGVYLGGAGGTIAGFGVIKGICTDANGNLILIGEDENNIKLPPLRLDDVVTVFRSVYHNGEGPTVTIDPNPENPEHSAMIIRHSKATEDTYVGWILYQADRLMKSYTLGKDNKTELDVVSNVPGYSDVLETMYFGGGDQRKSQKAGNWERFWIVPAETNRYEGLRHELTLFDVPLKVKTQKMRWEKNKLVDDLTGRSSPGALAFTTWFTGNYDAVGAEQYLVPPKESGITEPVPVFTELRRIALMTAIAEKLRDQGVPMPFWMHDYDVHKVPFEHFTPGMEVLRGRTSGNSIQTARIFGGVELSPESKAVKTYSSPADVGKVPAAIRAEVEQSIKLAERLEQAIADTAPLPLTINRVSDGNREYKVVSIPGTETQALGPCLLDEIDLSIPVAGGSNIQLPRSFNSFFNPKGIFGQGWTMDLPRLQELHIPSSREGGKVSYTIGYELLTPLNSFYARFKDVQPVKELGGSRLQVPDTNGLFLGLGNARPEFLENVETIVLFLKDGQEWHFTKNGNLNAVKNGPNITVYEQKADGLVFRIISMLGGHIGGEIVLEYDEMQKLIKAVGTSFDNHVSMPVEVTYTYDDMGRLTGVTSGDETFIYCYEGSWVTAIAWKTSVAGSQPETLRSFQYNAQGQLLSEKADNVTTVHTVSQTSNGMIASSSESLNNGKQSTSDVMTTEYDRQMRPTKSIAPDGSITTWSYPVDGGVEMTVTTQDEQTIKVSDAADGKSRSLEQNGVSLATAQFNDSGKLTQLSEYGRSVLNQEWRQDGQLSRVDTPAQSASLEYDDKGILSAIMLHPHRVPQEPKQNKTLSNSLFRFMKHHEHASSSDSFSEWQNTKLDLEGRPTEITDYTGAHHQLSYDKWGGLAAVVQQTTDGKGVLGYQVKRDRNGRIEAINSSWENTAYTYSDEGNLQKIITTRGDRSAKVDFTDGKLHVMTGFDGGETTFENHQDGDLAGKPKLITCPNGLELKHEYDGSNRLSAVKVGTEQCVRVGYDPQNRLISYALEPYNL